MRDFQCQLEAEEWSKERKVEVERRTKAALKVDIWKQKEQAERCKQSKEADAVLVMLHSSTFAGFHVRQAVTMKRIKAYEELIASVKRERQNVRESFEAERDHNKELRSVVCPL